MTKPVSTPAGNLPRRAICGIDELAAHGKSGVTHVLSLVDPELAELDVFAQFPTHHRTILRFHDIIAPAPGRVMPEEIHVESILSFGAAHTPDGAALNILVHCHMGVSRSTAAMLTLMAHAHPDHDEDTVFARLRDMRPQAWPNSRMIRFADHALGRNGNLFAALRRHYGVQLSKRPDLGRWMIELGRQAEVDLAM